MECIARRWQGHADTGFARPGRACSDCRALQAKIKAALLRMPLSDTAEPGKVLRTRPDKKVFPHALKGILWI
jgi:hypothetical protein